MTIEQLRAELLLLPLAQRELLAINLLDRLSLEDQAEIDTAWNPEIADRSNRYHNGSAVTFDAQESLERVRERLATRELSGGTS